MIKDDGFEVSDDYFQGLEEESSDEESDDFSIIKLLELSDSEIETPEEIRDRETKYSNVERFVAYSPKIAISNNSKPLTISFDDVDKYDFEKKAFNEVIKDAEYVHL